MPGRAPTPTRLKLIHGDPGKRRRNDREPQPELGRPDCPDWLPDEAKLEWSRVADQLEAMRMLHTIDRGLLAAWSVAWQQFCDASKDIGEFGYTTTTDKGNEIQHPAVGVRNRAIEHMLKLAAQFGMSPAARTRIQVRDQPQKPTGKERFFAG